MRLSTSRGGGPSIDSKAMVAPRPAETVAAGGTPVEQPAARIASSIPAHAPRWDGRRLLPPHRLAALAIDTPPVGRVVMDRPLGRPRLQPMVNRIRRRGPASLRERDRVDV